jgi:hypothetical protein
MDRINDRNTALTNSQLDHSATSSVVSPAGAPP